MRLSKKKLSSIDPSTLLVLSIILIVLVNVYVAKLSISSNGKMQVQFEQVISDIHSYKLYLPENKDKLRTQGVYFSSGYYCVKTEGRNFMDIKMTDYHEMCHAFVDMDYDHFCNKENQTNYNIIDYLKK